VAAARGDTYHVNQDQCRARHSGIRWTITLLTTVLLGFLGAIGYALGEASEAQRMASEAAAELKADRAGQAEFKARVLAKLEEIMTELRELRGGKRE
jgi:hypothetical protein